MVHWFLAQPSIFKYRYVTFVLEDVWILQETKQNINYETNDATVKKYNSNA